MCCPTSTGNWVKYNNAITVLTSIIIEIKIFNIGYRSNPSRRFDANLIGNKLNRTKINNDYLTEDVGNQLHNLFSIY